jgi:hypothetical protein
LKSNRSRCYAEVNTDGKRKLTVSLSFSSSYKATYRLFLINLKKASKKLINSKFFSRMGKDYYQTLQLTRSATDSDIKAAYVTIDYSLNLFSVIK